MARGNSTPNRLLSFSFARPVLVMLVLFLLVALLKILDTFVLPLADMVGELILTKALGFLLLAAYVWACGRTLRDIGLHRQGLGPSLLIGGVCFGSLYVVAYAAQLIVMRAGGEDAALALSAIDPKTGMEGGLLFGLWLAVANVVNSAMEDGIWRGAMLRHFRMRMSAWGAILFQAFLFAIWHLNWPVRSFLIGEANLGEAAFEAAALLVGTAISGVVYGYLYHKTGNLWGPFLGHFINNTVLNIVFIRTAEGLQTGTEFPIFLVIFLGGHLAMIPLIGWWAKRDGLPEVTPWDSPEPV